jgi:hypothetical protein
LVWFLLHSPCLPLPSSRPPFSLLRLPPLCTSLPVLFIRFFFFSVFFFES